MAANGGLISKADLAAYKAVERAPVSGTFLGHEIISMPPPSSGGVALIEMLNILEELGIQKTQRGSAQAMHLVAEAMRRAFLDRARFLGDPDFVQVPVAKLTSKEHARDLVKSLSLTKASKSVELGKDIVTVQIPGESDETTHFSVLDKDGMAVTNTYTLEGGYGSHVVIKGTGILLNNEMGDFNKKPGTTNLTGDIGTPANVIAPGKRMLSSMTPTIVAEGRQGAAAHRIAGRPHDHQHRRERRPECHGVGHGRPRSGGGAAFGSRMAARSADDRNQRRHRRGDERAEGDGPRGAGHRPPGLGALNLGVPHDGNGLRHRGPEGLDVEGVKSREIDRSKVRGSRSEVSRRRRRTCQPPNLTFELGPLPLPKSVSVFRQCLSRTSTIAIITVM